nr:EOG090X06AF [Daphnia magna]
MNNKANLSIVEYFGSDKGHKCGYCKGSKSNLSHGMWAHTMNVEDYESLINRGWRRSGNTILILLIVGIELNYTIRCSTNNFRMSHSHKKMLKKMRNFLSKDADSAFATNCSSKAPIGKPSSVGSQTLPKTLEDYLEEEYHNPFNKLEIKLVDPTSSEFKKTMSSAYKLYVKEIAFSRQLGLSDPNFCWYYLGFYIHSCPKMFYKGQYKPSFLLCPETYTFQPFEECVIKLNRNKYSVLLEKTGDVYEDESISKVGILYRRQAATFDVYSLRQKVEEEEVKEVEEYAMLVGRSSSNRMLLYRS